MKNEVKADIENIIRAKEQNRLVIFAGSGISANSKIPVWNQLIGRIKSQITLSSQETDQLKIAQLFYNLRDRKEYYDFIKETLLYKKALFNPINEAIFTINPQHIITTNYDDLFEQVIKRDNLQYYLVRQDSDLPKSTLSTYLIKMHGCFETENIVLTENDYLNYSQNFPLIESWIKALFASRLVLFIGFSFSDINLKYILQRVDSVLGEHKQPSYIYLDGESNDLERDYLRKKKVFPVYFDEIKMYLDNTEVKGNVELNEKGNNVLRFLKMIEKPTFKEEELQVLPIAKQIIESLKPFKGFDFIMPTVIGSIWPFKEENKNENWGRAVYSEVVAKSMTIENPKLIEFFKNLTRFGENRNETRQIKTLAKLKQENDGDICTKIKEVTSNLVETESEYEELIKCIQILNHSFISYINREYNIRVEDIPKKCNCLSCRYGRFEFDEIVEILEKVAFKNEDISLSNNELKNRLLKGYTAAKMGLVKIAYIELQKAVDLAKNQSDEVSYFLAKYNLKHLVFFEGFSKDNFFKNLHNKIDLKDLLDGLKVEKEVRNELEKIINEKYLYEYIGGARKMREKIIEAYNLFSNGGGTTGSYEDNIRILINKLLIVHSFYRTNRILDTEFNLFAEFTEICFESLIYNFITPNLGLKPSFDKYPKIQEFGASILQSVILCCSPTKLHEILKKLGDKKIKMSDEERRNFVLSVTNFFKSFYTKHFGDVSGNDTVLNHVKITFSKLESKSKNVFQNIILLLGSIEIPDSDFNKTIEPFLNSLSVHNFDIFNNHIYWETYLSKNLNKFSESQQIRLLQIILKDKRQVSSLVELFSDAIYKQGKILLKDIEFIKPHLQSKYHNQIRILRYLYPISDENIKALISERVRTELNENFDSLGFYQAVSLKILEPSSFLKEAINDVKTSVRENFDVSDSSLSNFLYFVGKNNIDTRQESLRVFSDKNLYIKWLFHFETFDYQKFNNSWFDYVPTLAFLPKMSSNLDTSSLFRKYLKDNHKSEYYHRLLKIYFDYFSDNEIR